MMNKHLKYFLGNLAIVLSFCFSQMVLADAPTEISLNPSPSVHSNPHHFKHSIHHHAQHKSHHKNKHHKKHFKKHKNDSHHNHKPKSIGTEPQVASVSGSTLNNTSHLSLVLSNSLSSNSLNNGSNLSPMMAPTFVRNSTNFVDGFNSFSDKGLYVKETVRQDKFSSMSFVQSETWQKNGVVGICSTCFMAHGVELNIQGHLISSSNKVEFNSDGKPVGHLIRMGW